jgi:phosphoglycolate phosphatase-like HAD superfamily hydrolase
MTLSVSISPQAEARLRQQAQASGQQLDAYAAQLLEQAATARTVDEVLAPFRKEVADSGMSDQELDEFLEDLRQKAYQDRQRRPA